MATTQSLQGFLPNGSILYTDDYIQNTGRILLLTIEGPQQIQLKILKKS